MDLITPTSRWNCQQSALLWAWPEADNCWSNTTNERTNERKQERYTFLLSAALHDISSRIKERKIGGGGSRRRKKNVRRRRGINTRGGRSWWRSSNLDAEVHQDVAVNPNFSCMFVDLLAIDTFSSLTLLSDRVNIGNNVLRTHRRLLLFFFFSNGLPAEITGQHRSYSCKDPQKVVNVFFSSDGLPAEIWGEGGDNR